jgi:hypothetical protein
MPVRTVSISAADDVTSTESWRANIYYDRTVTILYYGWGLDSELGVEG